MPLAAVRTEEGDREPRPIVERRAAQHVHHHLTIGPSGGGPGSQAALAFVSGLVLSVIVVVILLAGLAGVYFRALGKIEGYVTAMGQQQTTTDQRLETIETALGLQPLEPEPKEPAP